MAVSTHAVADADALPRVLLMDEDRAIDVFEVLAFADGIVRTRSPFLFEVGEGMRVRIEQAGEVSEAFARVIAHIDMSADSRVSELELSERTQPRRVVGG